ncbi:hypothetical protein BLA29_010362, partial [Euroglyphus maynei]
MLPHNDSVNNNDNVNRGPSSFNSFSIATMANSRSTNGWTNQNLYVQPPARITSDSSLVNGNDDATRNDCQPLASPSAKLSH